MVADGTGGHKHRSGKRSDELLLPGVAIAASEGVLLPTPSASDGIGGGPNDPVSRIEKGHQVQLIDLGIRDDIWGRYADAIHRWEQIVGPAPSPTEPNSKGNPRLNPRLSEWMMGWPSGWVTDFVNPKPRTRCPAGYISRADVLRIIGNGVVSQQAVYALRLLLGG